MLALQARRAGPHGGDGADRADGGGDLRVRIGPETSWPSTVIVGASGSVPDLDAGSSAGGRDRVGVVDVDALLEHPPGHRAVHRAGVEVAQAEAARRRRGPRWTCPSPTGRRSRRRSRCASDRVAGTRNLMRRLAAWGHPEATRTQECTAQPRATSASTSALGHRRRDGELDQADGLPGRVLDAHVLDVDPGVAGVGEQPGQLAGLVRRARPAPRRTTWAAAVLAGQPGPPGVAPEQELAQRRSGPSRGRRPSSCSAAMTLSTSARSSVRTSATGSALAARTSIHRSGSEAATRVTSRRPWPVSASASSGPSASRAATRRGGDLRHVRHERDRGVVRRGIHRHGDRRRRGATSAVRPGERVRLGLGLTTTQGRPSNRSARAAPGPDRSRPAIGWVPTKCTARPTPGRTSRRMPALTPAVSTTVAATLPASRPATTSAVADGRDRDDREVDLAPVGGAGSPAPRSAARRTASGSRSVRCTSTPWAAQRQRDRGADQAGADDQAGPQLVGTRSLGEVLAQRRGATQVDVLDLGHGPGRSRRAPSPGSRAASRRRRRSPGRRSAARRRCRGRGPRPRGTRCAGRGRGEAPSRSGRRCRGRSARGSRGSARVTEASRCSRSSGSSWVAPRIARTATTRHR